MKPILFCLLILCSSAMSAQDVDSTKIPQTITLAGTYHMYITGNMSNWGDPEMINYLNQVRSQWDTANHNRPITVNVSSSFIRDAYQQMSYQPEGQATQFNEDIAHVLGPQITNPWLGAQLYEIKNRNFQARDQKITQTRNRFLQINKVQ